MGRTFSRQCPQCSNLVRWPDSSTYPFCSERCRLIDLGMWARGDYRIPTDDPMDDENWSDESLWENEGNHC